MSEIRTRFAPSPTGFMHLGSVRTALFAWLTAKKNNGEFILRIEDTDRTRLVEGSVEHIIKTLKALGIDYTEGPDIGGNYGPYFQSQRLDIYHDFAKKLIQLKRAYADPYSNDEVEKFRQDCKINKKPFLFRDYRPVSSETWKIGMPLRFLSNPKSYVWEDLVMGKLSAGEEAVDDFVIIKSDGYPTYNFAHIVDDYLMKITHVIRSQEFIASTPKFLNLYEALNFKVPALATLPPVLSSDGKKKLSKRDGAKDILEYLSEGFLPESLINLLASLGFNDGTTQELFSTSELIEKFDLKRVQRSGAIFDEKRLQWMNNHYIRQLSLAELAVKFNRFWPPEAATFDDEYKQKVLKTFQERLRIGSELADLSLFFFKELPVNLNLIKDHKQLSKLSNSELSSLLKISIDELTNVDFNAIDIQNRLNELLTKTDQKPVVLFSLIRIGITEAPSSPGLAETMEVLGKESTLKRLGTLLQALA